MELCLNLIYLVALIEMTEIPMTRLEKSVRCVSVYTYVISNQSEKVA